MKRDICCRDQVIREVLDAPRRRVDNEISRLTEAANELMIHAKVVDFIVCQYSAVRSSYHMQSFAFASTSALATAIIALKYKEIKWFVQEVAPSIALSLSIDKENTSMVEWLAASSSVALSSATAFCGLSYWHELRLKSAATSVLSSKNLQVAFDNIFLASNYGKSLSYLRKLWVKVHSKISSNITDTHLQQMTRLATQDWHFLARIQEDDIPGLRRRADPNHVGLPTIQLGSSSTLEAKSLEASENGV
jgi:hypothetical protein